MPIEIRELIIKAVVEEEAVDNSKKTAINERQLKEQILAACKAIIKKQLDRNKHR